jgi:hypothetical protein
MEKIGILIILILGIMIFFGVFWHQIKNFRSSKKTANEDFFESSLKKFQ